MIYGFEISHYDDLLKVFYTYLISTAKVREPSSYAIPLNKFEWIIDKFTIAEEVTENNEDEEPLPLPTRLNTISFVDIEKQVPDLLAVVANIGSIKYYGSEDNRCQKAIAIDDKAKDNEQMLTAYTMKSSSELSSSQNVAPFEDEIIFISNIPSQYSLPVKAKHRPNTILTGHGTYGEGIGDFGWWKEEDLDCELTCRFG
ncbi:hypothetical protein HAX54_003003 [Datura stramonium]|uniref:Uncharacterized protein n=1 Tax=Datura stramonium TaxID=4076 RepID=A0ABS8WTV8_DATST|nr:hypothetical protein [Datura stramonium]